MRRTKRGCNKADHWPPILSFPVGARALLSVLLWIPAWSSGSISMDMIRSARLAGATSQQSTSGLTTHQPRVAEAGTRPER